MFIFKWTLQILSIIGYQLNIVPCVFAGGPCSLFFNIVVLTLSRSSRVRLFVSPWTVALQASLCMGFCRQECWSGLPCLPPGDLPAPGIEPMSPTLLADSLSLSHQGSPMTFHIQHIYPVKNDHSWGVKKALFKTKRNSLLIRDSDTGFKIGLRCLRGKKGQTEFL